MSRRRYYNTSLRNLIYRLRRFRDILDAELPSIIAELEPVILSMVTDNQLYEKGINSKGISIHTYRPYKPSTVRQKLRKGQPVDRVTLRDTGKFYNSLFLVSDSQGFYIDSTDPKAKDLLAKYNPNVLALTRSNFNILLNEFVKPRLQQRLNSKL